MAIAPFQELFTFFDASVIAVVTNGTAKMISLISPLVAAGFGIYLMLILSSYWRGEQDDPLSDFFLRMVGWAAVISFGLNIGLYTTYVVPFVNGLGDDLAGITGEKYNSAAALDTMGNALIDVFIKLFGDADGIKETMYAVVAIASVGLLCGAFMVIAIAYIILAKLALGVLIAVGPFFIASALFPATREFFKNWTAQCLNYAFLIMLFSFVAQIEIAMVSSLIPTELSLSALLKLILSCAVLIFVSLNLPSLAASLAGGIGISSMVRKLPGLPRIGRDKQPEMSGGKGGEMEGTKGPEGQKG